jgi:hypothetical protein
MAGARPSSSGIVGVMATSFAARIEVCAARRTRSTA